MNYRVELTKQAQADLDALYAYIAFSLQSPINAAGQLDRLQAEIRSLDHMPYRYRKFETEPWAARGVRVMPVDHYLVLYIPDDEAALVVVLRVLYGGRDIDRELLTHSEL